MVRSIVCLLLLQLTYNLHADDERKQSYTKNDIAKLKKESPYCVKDLGIKKVSGKEQLDWSISNSCFMSKTSTILPKVKKKRFRKISSVKSQSKIKLPLRKKVSNNEENRLSVGLMGKEIKNKLGPQDLSARSLGASLVYYKQIKSGFGFKSQLEFEKIISSKIKSIEGENGPAFLNVYFGGEKSFGEFQAGLDLGRENHVFNLNETATEISYDVTAFYLVRPVISYLFNSQFSISFAASYLSAFDTARSSGYSVDFSAKYYLDKKHIYGVVPKVSSINLKNDESELKGQNISVGMFINF